MERSLETTASRIRAQRELTDAITEAHRERVPHKDRVLEVWNHLRLLLLDQIAEDVFSPSDPGLFQPLLDRLLDEGDPFMVLADYASYVRCQEGVSQAYGDEPRWTRMSILNTANTGKFSSDRSIREYADEIWKVRPVPVKM